MTRYYFPSWDGEHAVPDKEGIELASLDEARTMAARALTEMASDLLLHPSANRTMEISIEAEREVTLLRFRLSFEIKGRR